MLLLEFININTRLDMQNINNAAEFFSLLLCLKFIAQ